MRNFLLLCIFCQSYCAIAQNTQSKAETGFPSLITSFKTYGYVGSIRLDSVDAQYATIDWRLNLTVTFDYGQYKDGTEESTITDSKSLSLVFQDFNIAGILNFFYFNGWQLTLTHRFAGDKEDTILLQKRNK